VSVSNIRAYAPGMKRSGATERGHEEDVRQASLSLAGEFLRAAAGKERAVVLAAVGKFLGQIEMITGSSSRSEDFRLIEAAMNDQKNHLGGLLKRRTELERRRHD
jgi:hypothetical protein